MRIMITSGQVGPVISLDRPFFLQMPGGSYLHTSLIKNVHHHVYVFPL